MPAAPYDALLVVSPGGPGGPEDEASIVIGWTAQTWNVPMAAAFAGTSCLLGIVAIRFTLLRGRRSAG